MAKLHAMFENSRVCCVGRRGVGTYLALLFTLYSV